MFYLLRTYMQLPPSPFLYVYVCLKSIFIPPPFHPRSVLYEHYPRPKEFILVYRIQDVLASLLRSRGEDAEVVIQQANRLMQAFEINVLL